ncbi:MAG: S8 family serine peptidase, partial [Tissierellia bacterium]|nr:S8 family serine peptidase [Tissierellia bacterium]
MSVSKSIKRRLSTLIALIMILGSLSSLAYAEESPLRLAKEDLQQEAASKIMPEVKEDLEKEDIVEVLVYMKDQVDTTNVAEATRKAVSMKETAYKTRLMVRRAVVEALQDKAERTQFNLLKYLEQEKAKGNVIEYDSHYIVNMVYVKAKADVIENISYRSDVAKIYKNKTHKREPVIVEEVEVSPEADNELEWNIERVKAELAWDLGIDGTGAVVGQLDSGVDWTHPALQNKWRGYNPETGETDPSKNWFDPVYGASLPADSDSHGTHVMGTMVG